MQTVKKIILVIILVNLLSLVPFLLINSIGHRALTVSLHLHNHTDQQVQVNISHDFKYQDIPTAIHLKPGERRDLAPSHNIRGPHDWMEFSVNQSKTRVYLYKDDRKQGESTGNNEKAIHVNISPNTLTARVTTIKHTN